MSDISENVAAILDDFGFKLVQDVQENLKKKQKEKASRYRTSYNPNSSLVNSIKFKVIEGSGSVMFELKMADYFDYVDRGRRAGNVSENGQSKIKRWVKIKGLNPVKIITDMRDEWKSKNPPKNNRKWKKKPKKLTFEKAVKQFGFIASRKVARFGYDGNFFYSEIIMDGRMDKLKEEIQKELNTDIEILISDFKELG
jgi:hypothetical protein